MHLPLHLLSLVLAATTAAATPLTDCLTSFSVSHTTRGSSAFTPLVSPFNLRFSPRPAPLVVALAATHHDVQACVKCASQTSTKLSVKAGGHSYGAYGLSAALVVNIEALSSVSVSASTGIATVGAGIRLGNLANALYAAGGRAVPHGTCPGVGLGGHATLGGFGLASRLWGLTVDAVVAVRVVYGAGASVWASATSHPELFWAMRGAGAGLGVATAFQLQTRAAPAQSVSWMYSYTFASAAAAAAALDAIQAWGLRSAPAATGFGVLLFPGGTMNLRGVYYGSGDTAMVRRLLAPLVATLRAIYGRDAAETVKVVGWLEGLADLAGSPLATQTRPGAYNEHGTFYAKSLVTAEARPLSLAALQRLTAYLYGTAAPGGVSYMVIFNLYGGPGSRINEPAAGSAAAGAYAHRDGGYVVQCYADVLSGGWRDAVVGYVNGMVGSMGAEASALPAYAPYADPQLAREEAQRRYWGDGVARIAAVKRQYDPKGVVYNPQGF
ncbi:hypothetical protein EDC01DRAFT_706804 [Geopyxis carbonaria]|nr:hypothetical protein EDC01DRAFT_706804 [Geopyxis carbonaria]